MKELNPRWLAPGRATTVFRRLLAVRGLYVLAVRFEEGSIVVRVRPTWGKPRCGECEKVRPQYDRSSTRRWRSLNLGAQRVQLEYRPRRVDCWRCKAVRTEKVSWAAHGSNFTYDFEELAAYLAQTTDKTSVTRLMGIAWRTVGKIVERVVGRYRDGDQLGNPRNIGVDEFSYRRFHRYMTVVVDHDARRVIWCGKGRGSTTLKSFLDELGPERCAAIEHATIDFSAGYRKALRERLPDAEIIYDRFHVQRLASDALDEVRRDIVRSLEDSDVASAVKGTRWSLLKSPWDLSGTEKVRLAEVERRNKPLYRAYLLKEFLAKALGYRQPKRAREALDQWLGWASRSKLKPFVRIARTIRKHREGILAYVRTRLTNGLVEGINNRLRMITRRAFGFHSFGPLAAMLHLCCGGIELSPPLP